MILELLAVNTLTLSIFVYKKSRYFVCQDDEAFYFMRPVDFNLCNKGRQLRLRYKN